MMVAVLCPRGVYLQRSYKINGLQLQVTLSMNVHYKSLKSNKRKKFTYIVIKRKTNKFMLAATTASPNRMNIKLRAT